MKLLITSFLISALSVAQIDPVKQYEFVDFFRMAYTKSYSGLENMRDKESGKWQFENAVGDFDRCTMRFDLEKGVNVIELTRFAESASGAEQFMTRFSKQLVNAMPVEEYQRSDRELNGKKAITYIYKSSDASVRAKNPEVVLSTTFREGRNMMIVSLYEPMQKSSE
jgi:hypothetical protein